MYIFVQGWVQFTSNPSIVLGIEQLCLSCSFYIIIDEEILPYDEGKEGEFSDYENLPEHLSNTKRLIDLAEDVKRRTGNMKIFLKTPK